MVRNRSLIYISFLWLGWVVICLAGCYRADDEVEKALRRAGRNRSELEKVLNHYSYPEGDSLKYEAARFLISNMVYHGTMYSEGSQRLFSILDSIQRFTEMDHQAIELYLDSLMQEFELEQPVFIPDIETVKGNYLIRNIDQAFEAWRSPWASTLSFEEFCELILPYRVGREQLTDWREVYRKRFEPLVWEGWQVNDSGFFRMMDTLSACYNSQTFFFTGPVPEYPSGLLLDVKRAPCKDYVNLFTMIGRATGIPVLPEFIPQWATGPMGHDWNMVRFNGKEYDFLIGEGYPPGEHFNKFYLNRTAKIYRYCFGKQNDWVPFVAAGREKLYPFFTVPNLRDVTSYYLPVVHPEVPDLFPVKPEKQSVYLAVFDNTDWIPVAWGRKQGNTGVFRDVAVGTVVLPVYYHKGKTIPAQYPVKIDRNGEYTILRPDRENRQRMVLWRKYRDTRALQLAAYMEGGVFELADNSDFRDALRIPVGDSVALNYQTLLTGTDRIFTHFRYLPKPETPGYIAEIELYDPQGDLIQGEVTGTYIPYLLHKHIRYMEYVFDGDPLTYANCLPDQKDAWVGLVLEKPAAVERIVFLPRSDDNFIKDNEQYELFYWEKEWVSVGKMRGERSKQYLEYHDVPGNALYLLRNLSKGKEERIFTYENGEQVWW